MGDYLDRNMVWHWRSFRGKYNLLHYPIVVPLKKAVTIISLKSSFKCIGNKASKRWHCNFGHPYQLLQLQLGIGEGSPKQEQGNCTLIFCCWLLINTTSLETFQAKVITHRRFNGTATKETSLCRKQWKGMKLGRITDYYFHCEVVVNGIQGINIEGTKKKEYL